MSIFGASSSFSISWAIASLMFLIRCSAAPTLVEINRARIFLSQYGYLSPPPRTSNSAFLIHESSWKQALTDFQDFAGLNRTGELDEKTTKLMAQPRCGVKDNLRFGRKRTKRFVLQGSRWRTKDLTYRILKFSSRLSNKDVEDVMAKAFSVWSAYTDLTFTKKESGQVHIDIKFEKGAHGDNNDFDGPGGMLAHAAPPTHGGDVHFDDDETWSINSGGGFNLLKTAAHEIGHALGLEHSAEPTALMANRTNAVEFAFQLHQDDINGIQKLYGPKTTIALRDESIFSFSTTMDDPVLCSDDHIDTILTSAEGVTFVFKGDHYWQLTDKGVAVGYPRAISLEWPGLPGNIDAAFTYSNGNTYFFKGSDYWKYTGGKWDSEYPKKISTGFPGIPDNIDAALVWSDNRSIFFYKGSTFWKYDPARRPPVKAARNLSNWKGIPDNIDAVLRHSDEYTYFFKDGAYWRFDNRIFRVDADSPAFPRSTGFWWLGCSSAPRGTIRDPDSSDRIDLEMISPPHRSFFRSRKRHRRRWHF